jgi:hypothetical protein
VFCEGDVTRFDPKCVKSHFLHVFILVHPILEGYAVSVWHDPSVPAFGPLAPDPPLFVDKHSLRDYLLAKAINGENAAYHAQTLQKLHRRTRDTLMDTFVEQEMSKQARLTSRKSIRIGGKHTSIGSVSGGEIGLEPPQLGIQSDYVKKESMWKLSSPTISTSPTVAGRRMGVTGDLQKHDLATSLQLLSKGDGQTKSVGWFGRLRRSLDSTVQGLDLDPMPLDDVRDVIDNKQ